MGSTRTPTTRIPSVYQMPDEVILHDKQGNAHRVVTAESMRRVLMTIYNQINNPPLSTTTNVTSQTPSSAQNVYNETPADSGDHQNFSLQHSPNPAGSLTLFVNTGSGGQPLQQGPDYTLMNNLITLASALSGTFSIWANYSWTS